MRRRLFMALAGLAQFGFGQQAFSQQGPEFVCPMDPDVKSDKPGRCPRCGMQMVARILEPALYGLEVETRPKALAPGKEGELAFRVLPPDGSRGAVREFEEVHEKLCHLFAVNQDLSWFLHGHPVLGEDGTFRLPVTFPRDGLYALFVDLYPRGGTPQWLPHFLYAGKAVPARVAGPGRTLTDGDTTLTARLDPLDPFAGQRLVLYCEAQPAEGLERWLGAYAHGFWVSHDMADAAHTHPITNDGALNFEVYFPRPGNYRFWIQFQRTGTLRTTYLDIAVAG